MLKLQLKIKQSLKNKLPKLDFQTSILKNSILIIIIFVISIRNVLILLLVLVLTKLYLLLYFLIELSVSSRLSTSIAIIIKDQFLYLRIILKLFLKFFLVTLKLLYIISKESLNGILNINQRKFITKHLIFNICN